MVDIPSGVSVTGIALGRLRATVDIDAFRISRHPVTREELGQCEAAGACAATVESTCDLSENGPLGAFKLDEPTSPALCVPVAKAQAYCAWIGGRLPTADEWMRAARGSEPSRYAWGAEPPSCERHPRAQQIAPATAEDVDQPIRMTSCAALSDGGALLVSKYPDGAAPGGIEDVLIAPAELLGAQARALVPVCNGTEASACLVTSSSPGSIDSFAMAPKEREIFDSDNGASAGLAALSPHAFRCVIEGDGT